MMTREEHVAWCKKRALEYVAAGDFVTALINMARDLNKHEETRDHAGAKVGMGLMLTGGLRTKGEMTKFIEGFS